MHALPESRLRFETFELNLHTRELHNNGSLVHLQSQPMRLLALLASHPGELVTRETIQEELWRDGEFVEFEHSINTAIMRIRKALNDTADPPRIVQTLPRRVYRFIAAVSVVESLKPTENTPPPVRAKKTKSANDDYLPISVGLCRVLFLLAQVPYVGSYIAALANIDGLDAALGRTVPFIPVEVSLRGFLLLVLIGLAVRIYLIGLVAWKHADAGPRYQRLFPYLLPLDAIWTVTPLLVEKLGPVLSWAGLVLMAWLIFGQRQLMKSIERSSRQDDSPRF